MALTYKRIVELLRMGMTSGQYRLPFDPHYTWAGPFMCFAMTALLLAERITRDERDRMHALIKARMNELLPSPDYPDDHALVWRLFPKLMDVEGVQEHHIDAIFQWYETWIEELEANDITRC